MVILIESEFQLSQWIEAAAGYTELFQKELSHQRNLFIFNTYFF